jgi:hypothetical protein
VDIRIEKFTRYTLDSRDPDVVKPEKKSERDMQPKTLSASRDAGLNVRADRFPELLDFYSTFDELDVTPEDRRRFKGLVERLGERDAALLKTPLHFTVARFVNDGGIPTPLPLRISFADGSFEETTIPAEIWRYAGGAEASKLFVTAKEIVRVELDRRRETADRDPSDNAFPQEIARGSFAVEPRDRGTNPMRTAQESERREKSLVGARALGTRVAEAVKAGKSAGSVAVDATERDGWDRAFLVLDGAGETDGGVAQVVSAGADGVVGTEDDITFIVGSDGTVKERARRPRGST